MFSSFSTALSLSKSNEICTSYAPSYRQFANTACRAALITYITDKIAQRLLPSTATSAELAEFKKTCTQAIKGFVALWEGTLTRRFFNTLTEFLVNYQWPNASTQQRMVANVITDILSEVLHNLGCPAKAIVSATVNASAAIIGAESIKRVLADETDTQEEKAYLETNRCVHLAV